MSGEVLMPCTILELRCFESRVEWWAGIELHVTQPVFFGNNGSEKPGEERSRVSKITLFICSFVGVFSH